MTQSARGQTPPTTSRARTGGTPQFVAASPHAVPVFRAERDAGVADAVRTSGRVVLASVARAPDRGVHPPAHPARAAADRLDRVVGSETDFDLHHIDAILVTTGWNKNDDVFDRAETWLARESPKDKQLNHEHDDGRIVGHILSNTPVGADGEAVGPAIPDDTALDDLPSKFHILTGAVIYKHWQTPTLQKWADALLAEVAKGGMFLSMECLFRGFDYALEDGAGVTRVVARTDQTAFLTKHLRAYGGTGRYGEYRVGRVLRSITFSGMALVKNPANPESVILPPKAKAPIPTDRSSAAWSTAEGLARRLGLID